MEFGDPKISTNRNYKKIESLMKHTLDILFILLLIYIIINIL